MPRNKHSNPIISKRFQTELQCMLAFSCYDNDAVLGAGKSENAVAIQQKMRYLYMPSLNENDDHMSQVEKLLEGRGVFSSLYKRETIEVDGVGDSSSYSKEILVFPEVLHGLDGRIIVGDQYIDKSLLTRKNMTNTIDISGLTVFRHAKEVEKNSKKALSFCLAEDSPYKNFDGIFPSGTNWNDYITWLRNKMSNTGTDDIADDVGDDNSILDDDATAGTANTTAMEENTSVATPVTAATVENDTSVTTHTTATGENDTAGGNDAAKKTNNDEGVTVGNKKKTEDYFKGFFAFALWGFIPPPGGDGYKSALISSVVDTETSIAKDMSRNSRKIAEVTQKAHERELEKRGTSSTSDVKELTDLVQMFKKGKKEMSKQRLFRVRIGRINDEMKMSTTRVNEIRVEIQDLKDDLENDGDEDDIKEQQRELKNELKLLRYDKKSLYSRWKVMTDAEEARQTLLDIESDEEDEVRVVNIVNNSPGALSSVSGISSVDDTPKTKPKSCKDLTFQKQQDAKRSRRK